MLRPCKPPSASDHLVKVRIVRQRAHRSSSYAPFVKVHTVRQATHRSSKYAPLVKVRTVRQGTHRSSRYAPFVKVRTVRQGTHRVPAQPSETPSPFYPQPYHYRPRCASRCLRRRGCCVRGARKCGRFVKHRRPCMRITRGRERRSPPSRACSPWALSFGRLAETNPSHRGTAPRRSRGPGGFERLAAQRIGNYRMLIGAYRVGARSRMRPAGPRACVDRRPNPDITAPQRDTAIPQLGMKNGDLPVQWGPCPASCQGSSRRQPAAEKTTTKAFIMTEEGSA